MVDIVKPLSLVTWTRENRTTRVVLTADLYRPEFVVAG